MWEQSSRGSDECASLTGSKILCLCSWGQVFHAPMCHYKWQSNVTIIADDLGLHNDLQITKYDSRVILSWNNNLTEEETKKYSVKYILSYTFFNTSYERKVSCSTVTHSLKWNHIFGKWICIIFLSVLSTVYLPPLRKDYKKRKR